MAEIATQPWIEPTIELYSPDGQFLDQNTNSESATINVTATVTGRYTVICRDANGQAGSYGVSANFISDPSCELAPPSPTCKPRLLLEGDVDGNGTVDITDPIYLLSYLFLGGHPPAPICGGPLPSTGQIKCFDAAGAEIDCANSDCPGQDGLYQSGCPTEGRFVDNGDGTVTDKCTGLMWQKAAADVNGDGQSTEEDVIRWCDALTYCQGLDFAGHHDWRLPNVRELQSIVDYSRFNPAIDPAFDLIPFTSFFWSSTSSVASPDSVWGVFFSSGSVTAELKPEGGNIVRAVRNAR
jgi:hypothetical protein